PLRAGRDVRQLFGVDARDLHALELDFQIAQARPGDLAEQLQGHGLRALLAGDLAHRAAAQRRDGAHDAWLVGAAQRDGVEGPALAGVEPPQALRERHRVGVARGDDAVADVDDVRPRAALPQRLGERDVEVGPAEGGAPGQVVARRLDVRRTGRRG